MDKDSEVETTDRDEGTDTPAPDDGEDSDDITNPLAKVKAGAYSGQICTLKTLIDDDIVKTGDAVLSLEYMVSLYQFLCSMMYYFDSVTSRNEILLCLPLYLILL